MEFVVASKSFEEECKRDLKMGRGRTDYPVVFTVTSDVYAKNMGKKYLVFEAGGRYEGIIHTSGAISSFSYKTGHHYILRGKYVEIEKKGWL